MRIFLTGGTGFIGSHVAERLRGRSHSVAALVRETSDTAHLESLGCDTVVGDVMAPADELAGLMRGAGFREVEVRARRKSLRLPAPEDFLWQYVHSTPLAEAAGQADRRTLEALEGEVCAQWQDFVVDGRLSLEVGMTTASAVK